MRRQRRRNTFFVVLLVVGQENKAPSGAWYKVITVFFQSVAVNAQGNIKNEIKKERNQTAELPGKKEINLSTVIPRHLLMDFKSYPNVEIDGGNWLESILIVLDSIEMYRLFPKRGMVNPWDVWTNQKLPVLQCVILPHQPKAGFFSLDCG